MNTPLTSDDSVLDSSDADANLRSYISRFVSGWRERQERLTLNKAAIQKAEREWKAEQERERNAARDLHPHKG